MSQKPCLYEDNTVRITTDQIKVLQYFYPLPMDKTINMCDVKQVNLKTDVDKHSQYLEVVVKGFSMNATFSPKDPKKCLEIIRCHSCFDLAGRNIEEAKRQFKSGVEDIKEKAVETKEDIKQGAKDVKYQAEKKLQEGKQGAKDIKKEAEKKLQQGKQQIKQSGIVQSVTSTIAQGWQEVKQVSQNIYEAATEKIHDMTAPETQQKAKQAKQNIKQGVKDLKEGAKEVGRDVEKKYQQGKCEAKKATGMEPEKTTYENIKETAVEGWENLKQGAQNVYNKAAEKVSEVVGTDVESKAKQAKQDIKQGAKDAKESVQKALPQKPLTQQAKQKVQQWTGTDAKGKAEDAKQHFKQGLEDTKQSVKKATGYEGSKLQQAKEDFVEGCSNIKKGAQNAYDTAATKLGQIGSSTQQAIGQKTKQAGQALKQKGSEIKKNA